MLTPDLVQAKSYRGQLRLTGLSSQERIRAISIAELLLDHARSHLGVPRADVEESQKNLLSLPPKEKKVALGLSKLIEDDSEFESNEGHVPATEIRRELWTLATNTRRANTSPMQRSALLEQVATAQKTTVSHLEQSLFSDLRTEQRLIRTSSCTPEELVQRYEHGQAQAILIRALDVDIDIRCASRAAYRSFLRKVKFLQLIASISELPNGGYRIHIEGPLRLFEATTKYGLQLALLLPELYRHASFHLRAKILWGAKRIPLLFELSFELDQSLLPPKALMPKEIDQFLSKFVELGTLWDATPATDVLHLPGVGTCIPDVQFVHREKGQVIYLELLGYWSRDAVFKRVELMEKGFPHHILFAASKRLRVSEKAFDASLQGRLYLFSDVLRPSAVLEHLESIASTRHAQASEEE